MFWQAHSHTQSSKCRLSPCTLLGHSKFRRECVCMCCAAFLLPFKLTPLIHNSSCGSCYAPVPKEGGGGREAGGGGTRKRLKNNKKIYSGKKKKKTFSVYELYINTLPSTVQSCEKTDCKYLLPTSCTTLSLST